jgi:tetratricopeptide (TPR) repeat protein
MVTPSFENESTIDPKTKIEDYLLVHKLVPEAVRLMNRGDYKGGRNRFKKVESRFQNSFMLYWYLGYCYANLGDPGAAEKAYVRSIQLNPKFGRAYTELALTLALLNRHQDGIKLLDQAPSTALSLTDRDLIKGEIYTNQGSFDQAEMAYNAALKADPEDWEARYGLARVYLASRKVDQAVKEMQFLADQKYPSEDVYDSLAKIYQDAGAYAKAEQIYEQWQAVFPKSPNAFYRFGQFLIRQGQQERGSVLLRKAQELKD